MRLCPAWQLIHCRAPWRKSNPHWRAVKQQLRYLLTDGQTAAQTHTSVAPFWLLLMVALSHRCGVVAGCGAPVSSECIWEYATERAQPNRRVSGCFRQRCSDPLGQPTILRQTAASPPALSGFVSVLVVSADLNYKNYKNDLFLCLFDPQVRRFLPRVWLTQRYRCYIILILDTINNQYLTFVLIFSPQYFVVFVLQQISERTSCRLDLSDLQSCRKRFLGDLLYSEHHETGVFAQVSDLLPFSHPHCYFMFSYLLLAACHLHFWIINPAGASDDYTLGFVGQSQVKLGEISNSCVVTKPQPIGF